MKASLTFLLLLFSLLSTSQSVKDKLSAAVKKMESDSSMKHSIVSFYVINNKTGKVVYDKNSQIGLPAGSTQKVITSVTAFELLGKDYRYKTSFICWGDIQNHKLEGMLSIESKGDPTLGSWRFSSTSSDTIMKSLKNSLTSFGISEITDGIAVLNEKEWDAENIPGKWIWEDIGNYYGAAAFNTNWKENQYELTLKSDSALGSFVSIVKTNPDTIIGVKFSCIAKSAEVGSGDKINIYYPSNTNSLTVIRGTIPRREDHFKVYGAIPYPNKELEFEISNYLIKSGIKLESNNTEIVNLGKEVMVHKSPTLDSMNYWFLQKSINLYGEAFLKTMAYEKTKVGSTDSGVAVIKDFWSKRGIDKSALNIKDGSGLSPANRITANALVTVLNYAKTKPWFSSFYDALPYVNGFKMKSGTIGDVLAYTGYIGDYTFAIIVNNYEGKSSDMRLKMLFLLDNLK